MFHRIHLALALAMLALVTSALAQTPPAANLPWNNYTPLRIEDQFSSIIGGPGTVLVSGSSTDDDGAFQIPLNFPFFFIDRTYNPSGVTNGYQLNASTNGYVSFNNPTYWQYGTQTCYLYYTTSTYYGYYCRNVMVWWADRYANGVSDGGIYYQYTGDAPNRILTIEWRNMDWPSGPEGNFQVRFYERNGNIEYNYGPGTAGNTNWTATYGQPIGIKNYGQNYGTPSGNDAEKYLLFTDPNKQAEQPYAYTRLWVSGTTPEYYRYYAPSPDGAYWFDDFPNESGNRISLRASRILVDASAKSVWFTPARVGNAYSSGASVTINARFQNMGAYSQQNIPVQADVYYNNGSTPVASRTGTIFTDGPAPTFATWDLTFAIPVGAPTTNLTGEYRVHVYPKLIGDEDIPNDTAKNVFYIVKPNDVMPYEILQPLSNVAPLFQKYPLGIGVPLEIRYLNIGLNNQSNVPVGVWIYDASGNRVHADSTLITGTWAPLSFRDVIFPVWVPTTPGNYFVKAWTRLANDEYINNDTLPRWPSPGKQFDVRYEIEIAAGGTEFAHSPTVNAAYPLGRPIKVSATFINSGVSDATDVPVRARITGPGGIVYDRSVNVMAITSDNGQAQQRFPDFIPSQPGRYCVTVFSEYPDEPVRSNDTATWCFIVKPALSGTIRIGFGERYRTLQEARDSLMFYGVSGPVAFELTNDVYTVSTNEPTTPALDFRGGVFGLGPNNRVVFRPAAAKTMVTVHLKSTSGIGMWFGQRDTSNPSGYITWDGGPRKALTITYENLNTSPAQPAYQRSIPFFFAQGASNYGVTNCTVRPYNAASGKLTSLTIPMVRYNQSFNEFQYSQDLSIAVSAAILLRNSAPIDPVIGRNWNNRDTLRNQNNVFEGNTVSGFGYGILSVGAGPLFVVGTGRYEEYLNQNNKYNGNTIQDVVRGGVTLAYEKGSEIIGNTIRRISNTSTMPDAAGVFVTSGGAALVPGAPTPNRAYSSELKIEKNRIYDLATDGGNVSAISIETNENVFITPANVVYRFPAGAATNVRIWNNSLWDFTASGGQASAIAFRPEQTVRIDFVTTGNRVENNTVYNVGTGGNGREQLQISRYYSDVGVVALRSGMQIRNNIINLEGWGALGLMITMPNYLNTAPSDYNAFDIPNGYVGVLTRLSPQGYWLPSPAAAPTLNQWRTLAGLDLNSIEGDVTREFISTTPGSEDLHIQTNLMGSLVGNRGTVISGLATDIDGEPRGASAVAGRYDIGSDEFTGQVRNFDLMAEDVISPAGYRAPYGQFSDAEYVMTDTLVTLISRVRNVGGHPVTNRSVTLTIEYLNPISGLPSPVSTQTLTVSADVAQYATTSFGTFMPRSLRELGLSDAMYGSNSNVSPLYRFTVRTGIDDYQSNNSYSKLVRFYVQRSGREAMVSVENLNNRLEGSDPVSLANALNADTLFAALTRINWGAVDGVGREDYDIFERDKWPAENLNFAPWTTMIWAQGSEAEGLNPFERVALKAMLNAGTSFFRSTLIIAGQDVARIHDVALTADNGYVSDQDFARNYLRTEYRGNTRPADYSNRTIRGEAINFGRFEELEPTGVAGDDPPMPSLLRSSAGEGVARASHIYSQQVGAVTDSMAGVASSAMGRNVVYYGFDWRHAGRYNYEPDRSGAWRLLLGALDFSQTFRGVLPIELLSFEAYQSSERSVNVEWATAMESEINAMQIERASVARDERGEHVGSYTVVENVPPRGTATTGARYRVIDRGVDPGAEYLYRLVTTSLEGARVIEREQRVKMTGSAAAGITMHVLPNPIRTSGAVSVTAPAGAKSVIALFDGSGRLVMTLGELTGSGSVNIDAATLPSGAYTVRVRTSAGVNLSERITVAR